MKKMHWNMVLALACIVLIGVQVGCSQSARRVDSRGPETITTVDNLDIQDATDAAGQLSQSLLESGILGRNGQPSVIAISRYVNNTSRQIDRDAVIKKIRVSLNKAGVAQTMTTITAAGNIGGEDTIAAKAAKERFDDDRANAFLNEEAAPKSVMPDYSLTFKLSENKARAGNIRQITYTFQMSLTDVNTGLAVWEDEVQVTKQGSKPSVGW